MAYFEWDPSLMTGCEEIDEQHRSLFDLANALEYAIGRPEVEEEQVTNAVYGLAGYVVEHFGDEEALMAEYRYPGLVPHRSLHEALTADATTVLARYVNGELDAAKELGPLICEWLTGHIRKHDISVIAFVENARRATAAS